jgi:hypothetical protein
VTVVSRSAWRRWLAVASGVAVLCALPAARAALPVPQSTVSAMVLRTRILASASLPYQGYVETTADLGLPVLPYLQGVTKLLDATTDQYAWYRSAGHWRADTLSAGGEDDVYQVCRTAFLWSSARNLLTRVAGAQPVRLPRAADFLPPALARTLLRLASPADHLSRLPSKRIAGVNAAGVRLVLASQATTVRAIEIWADPDDGLPIDVQIIGRASARPVLVSSFLQLSRQPPAWATVTPHLAPSVDHVTARLSFLNGILNGDRGIHFPDRLAGQPRVTIPDGLVGVAAYGTGFARFVLVPLPGAAGQQVLTAANNAGAASVPLPGGAGALVRTPLLTVLLARSDDREGRTFLLTGAVTPALLEQVASVVTTYLSRRP